MKIRAEVCFKVDGSATSRTVKSKESASVTASARAQHDAMRDLIGDALRAGSRSVRFESFVGIIRGCIFAFSCFFLRPFFPPNSN
jgi:hypothetical protein